MPGTVSVTVLRVFTDDEGRLGNELGIVDGAAVPAGQRQQLATDLGYSETVYVDDAAAGRIQIFTPSRELPFAGHPTVGTAWWLRRQGHALTSLQVPAGEVAVTYDGEVTRVRAHVDWCPGFVWHDLPDPAEVDAQQPAGYAGGTHYVWAWIDEPAGAVRSRMFAPDMGIAEDEATGAAAIAFTARQQRDLEITQGRGCRLSTTYEGDGWATVGGRTVFDTERSIDR
jgi:predicted PhzF superfamily epimerase YddE/YHI9